VGTSCPFQTSLTHLPGCWAGKAEKNLWLSNTQHSGKEISQKYLQIKMARQLDGNKHSKYLPGF
jgi:hypothetical protein